MKATLKVENASNGNIWVTLPYSETGVARIKRIPGRRWNPERKQWLLPDTPKTRAALAEIVVMPPVQATPVLAVTPKHSDAASRHQLHCYVAGRDKALTENPPHPVIKQVDDELVLRGMAYGTRKAYGQHLRNYIAWLARKRIVPECASGEQIREYLVQLAQSGTVSAAYCRGVRAARVSV